MKMGFILLLFAVVLISYGQLIFMHVWQDDNALFFKLAHISERAGYLGAGIFGDGPYKYIATPYIPIYKIFGFNTLPYFILAIFCYFLTTLVILKTLSEILGEKAGKLSAFLYAAGFVASDGFIRLFNTVITSLSICLISLLTLFYWRYYKERRFVWYAFAAVFYYLAIEFARGRTHYLIFIVFAFEAIFLAFRKPFIKSLVASIIRLVPFIIFFHRYFILNADPRSASVGKFLFGILNGSYYLIYGWLSTIANLLLSDRFTQSIFKTHPSVIWFISISLFVFAIVVLFKNHSKKKLIVPLILFSLFLWVGVSRYIFIVPVLNLGAVQKFSAFLGGAFILLFSAVFFAFDKISGDLRKLYLFFFIWFLVNIGAYSAYNPTVSYETINRYMAHSFFALVAVFGVICTALIDRKSILSRTTIVLLVLWGIFNLTSAVVYQNGVVNIRSKPAQNFYKQLKTYVPEVKKGDVFYFDVKEDSRSYFNDAFSVASMPETTAMAWRYGVDRYDIKMFTSYSNLAKLVALEKVSPGNIHYFWYSKQGLIDTSQEFRKLFFEGTSQEDVVFDYKDNVLTFKDPVSSIVPAHLILEIETQPKYIYEGDEAENNYDTNFINLAFNYLKFKNRVLDKAKFEVSSQWQDRVVSNVHDKDLNSVWQPDRVLWHNKNQFLSIDLGESFDVDRFVWVNGFGNNTPTKYVVETSLDGKNWQIGESVNKIIRIDTPDLQIVKFTKRKARFVRMRIIESLNDDASGISEAWVVESSLSGLDLNQAEAYLKKPFSFVSSKIDFDNLLKKVSYQGTAQIYWKNDKNEGWVSTANSKINLIYNSRKNSYEVVLPAGGTKLTGLKISDFFIPSDMTLSNVKVYYSSRHD